MPALRGRLKGAVSVAQTTGLATFESALQSIVEIYGDKTDIQFSKVEAIASQLCRAIEATAQEIAKELIALQEGKSEKF